MPTCYELKLPFNIVKFARIFPLPPISAWIIQFVHQVYLFSGVGVNSYSGGGVIRMDLKNVEVKIEDEDVAIVLLVSLPPLFESFVSSFVIGKDTITMEDVRSSFHSRELRQQASRSGYVDKI
ncbi:hypothetical protein Tco_0206084 [Tanacetum coccineum]